MLTFLQRQLDGRLGGERVPSSGPSCPASADHCAGRQREPPVGNGGRLQSGSVLDKAICYLASLYVIPISDIFL